MNGAEVERDVDAALVTEVSAFAKANKLSQEAAQAIMNRELQLAKDGEAATAKGLSDLKAQWNTETRALPEFSQNYDASLAVSKKALDTFFPGLAKDANKHPFLDNPQVLQGLFKIGQLISPEGTFVPPAGNSSPDDMARRMYPTMTK